MNFWNTKFWVQYLLNSRINNPYINHSFYFKSKFVPLLQDGEEFYSPFFEDDKNILEKVKELALENNIKRICVDSQIKSYLNISGYTCILDLDNIKLRKGHKSAISKAKKHITAHEYNTENIYPFMNDYFKVAGKQTRPEMAFKTLDSWLGKYGFLITAYCKSERVGAIYVLHYGNWAYYFMGYTNQKFKEYNVTHYLQSEIFKILKIKGIKYYELGNQDYNSLHYQPSSKDKNISLFKRGFGGNVVYKPKSEYFFDIDYLKKTMQNRIINYIGAEYNENIIDIPEIRSI